MLTGNSFTVLNPIESHHDRMSSDESHVDAAFAIQDTSDIRK
jgi:hypothetical protein